MSESQLIDPGAQFVPTTQEGDPGKHAYLHSVCDPTHNPEWTAKPFSQITRVSPTACPGCMFPGADPRRWAHVQDRRCAEWRKAHVG